jgi:hypothetical protein
VTGLGWPRLAAAVAEQIPPGEVDRVWVFATLRHDGREGGTPRHARADADRPVIYTARYMLAIKGKERGKFEAWVREVGSGPADALAQLVRDAQRRIDDEQPPTPVPPEEWFAAAADAPAH